MKSQTLSRSYIPLENEIQILNLWEGRQALCGCPEGQTQCACQCVGKIK